MRAVVAGGLVAALLVGCAAPHELPPAADRVPITQRAIAAIALQHLPDDTTSRRAMYTDRTYPRGTLGADLRYGGGGEADGDLVRVGLAPGAPEIDSCKPSECAELETEVEGLTLTLRWQEEIPESDPGVVSVLAQRKVEHAYAYQAGHKITGDPRDLDLPISVDQMVAIVEDPWLRLETSPEAIEAGEELDDWEGGEPEAVAASAPSPS